jgi:hypothetical protein
LRREQYTAAWLSLPWGAFAAVGAGRQGRLEFVYWGRVGVVGGCRGGGGYLVRNSVNALSSESFNVLSVVVVEGSKVELYQHFSGRLKYCLLS